MNFEKELETFETPEVKAACQKVLLSVNPKFYQVPASSTGKYHPEYALGEGGLYRHTQAAVGIANALLVLEMFQEKFDATNRDYIRMALILHDTCKSGKDWDNKYTRFDHPVQAAKFVKDILQNEIGDTVSELVSSHMGQWNTCKRDRTVLPKPETDGQKFVHMCDYLASRKFLEYKFD